MTQSFNWIGTSNPEAHITRTKEKNRGRLKIYTNNTVYLEKEEEFELELFNSTTNNILAKIEINGKLISSTGLVLKAGQRVYLERYFDSDKRFKFDVYEVEDWVSLKKESDTITADRKTLEKELTLRQQLLELSPDLEKESLQKRIDELKIQTKEMIELANELNQKSNSVQQATRYNGKIKVFFYTESTTPKIELLTSNHTGNINSPYGGGYVFNTSPNIYGTLTSNISNTIFTNSLTSESCSITLDSFGDFKKLSLNEDEIKENKSDVKNVLRSKGRNKETGRVSEGSVSNQKFETVNMNFSPLSFHTIEYTLLPYSEKPLEVKDLKQYCSSCGKKLSPSDNFCSSCGKKA